VLSNIFFHPGQPVAPHDLWSSWGVEPLSIIGLAVAAWLYWRGSHARRRNIGPGTRSVWFGFGLAAVAIALLSPLDAMASSLASAHMVQHVLLILVAAPMFSLGLTGETLLQGLPHGLLKSSASWRTRLKLTPARLRRVKRPALVWLLHAGSFWLWHSSIAYEAALAHQPLHVLEHLTFLLTGVMFWSVVFQARNRRHRSRGSGVMLVFTMAFQSVLLSALITFAEVPWYPAYATTTAPWGLDPLSDQQLAGVIMWIPAGLVYTGIGLALLIAWIRESEPAGVPT